MVPRIIFKDNNQIQFLEKVRSISGLDNNKLAILCQVSSRTFRDWLRGKLTISEKAFLRLTNQFNIPSPANIEIVDDYWYVHKGARKGALKRLELYGPIGTPEGRKKGGRISQLRRRENPDKYKLLGCTIPKQFNFSENYSVEAAEAVGIILGDGGITKDQLRVTISGIVDRKYADFICSLFQKVFGDKPTWHELKNNNAILLIISGSKLVEELKKWGLLKGNKIKNRVSFSPWIWNKIEYQKACVRGLMDTDGGCFFHTHTVNGLTYKNFGMCFTSYSVPILFSVASVLKSLELKFTITKGKIYIYDFKDIKKYFNLIGSNNPKNNHKFHYYLSQKDHRVSQ